MPNTGTESKLFFPAKLHALLTEADRVGSQEVVSWMPHGRSFRVHDHERFAEEVLPRLNDFSLLPIRNEGFQRLTAGPDRGAYFHRYFLRGDSSLCHRIERIKVKGKGHRKPSIPEEEPDFYTFPPLPQWKQGDALIAHRERIEPSYASRAAQIQPFGYHPSPPFAATLPLHTTQSMSKPSALISELRQNALEQDFTQSPFTFSAAIEGSEKETSALIAHLRQARASRYSAIRYESVANRVDSVAQPSLQSGQRFRSQRTPSDSNEPSRINTGNHSSRLLLLQSLRDQQVMQHRSLSLQPQRISELPAATPPSFAPGLAALLNLQHTAAVTDSKLGQTKEPANPHSGRSRQREQSHEWPNLAPKPPPGL